MPARLVSTLALLLLACRPDPNEAPESTAIPDPIVEPVAEPIVEPDEGQPVPAATSIELGLQTEVRATVGATLRWSFRSHGSVGYGSDYAIADETIVAYRQTDLDYEQSEAERAGKTGADAATGTLVFEALETGTTTLRVDAMFRGTAESSTTYTIIVE